MKMTVLCALSLCFCAAAALSLPRGKWAAEILAQRTDKAPTIASSRFSIYPKTTASQSLKATIKRAVSGLGGLGLVVEADDVSSVITGSQDAVFEAMSGVLGRACAVEGRPHVSMQCTISSDAFDVDIPERTRDADGWAIDPPSRVACQFAVYSICELGSCDDSVYELASESPSFVDERALCFMLDGAGEEVFRVLRASYELACKRSVSGHVVLTATLTAQKSSWRS